ncbi:MAG: hypothetical protein ACRD3V_12315 [Vicinamibacteria bacterium]
MAAYRPVRYSFRSEAEPVDRASLRTPPGLFRLLGAGAAVGRTFTEEEATGDRDPVVLSSDGFWRRQFGGALSLVLSRFLSGQLLRVGFVLGLAAFAASFLPAKRATRVDPIEALRVS